MEPTFDFDDLVTAQTHPNPERRQAAWSATVSLMMLASLRADLHEVTFEQEWAQIFDPSTLRIEAARDDDLGEAAREVVDDLRLLESIAEPREITAEDRVWADTTREHMRASINEWRRANS